MQTSYYLQVQSKTVILLWEHGYDKIYNHTELRVSGVLQVGLQGVFQQSGLAARPFFGVRALVVA